MASRSGATWSVEVTGTTQLKRAFRVLAEPDAPFLREALAAAGRILEHEAASRAPGGIAKGIGFSGVRGVGASLRAVISIKHPGARSMEFGRVWYYHQVGAGVSGMGNNRPGSKRVKGSMKTKGTKYRASPGQKAKPFLGVKDGGHAIGASKDRVVALIGEAFEREWERLGAE